MSLKLYRRKRGGVWHYRGSVDGRLLRGSTRATDRAIASQIAAEIETRNWKCRLDGPQEVLRFPTAVAHYLKAGKPDKYLDKLEDHWRNTPVKEMTAGAIRQSAIDLYPGCSGATWNRQVITPTQAIINHCAELELCSPVRIKRFKFEKKIKRPVTLEWLDIFCEHADVRLKALAIFLFATGCRISEARRVEWSDIDFQQRTILIRKTKNKRQRLPHMPQRLLVALANLVTEMAKEPASQHKPPFAQAETPLRKAWDAVVAKAAKAKTGFERLTFHSCRHGFATKLLRDGIDPKTAAGLGGWDSVSLFIETYAHAMPNSRLTEGLFDTKSAHETTDTEQKQDVRKK
jgi:integrase